MSTFQEAAAEADAQNEHLQRALTEALAKMDALMDQNWRPLLGGWGEDAEGPSLIQLHEASKRNRELMALNTHVKNGLKVRTSYVWEGGIHYSGIPGRAAGRATNVQERVDNKINQKYFFGSAAQEEREAALYCDSQVFYVGDSSDWTVRPVPISEITADLRNPNQSDEIWAYRRSWTQHSMTGNPIERVEWIYVNTFSDMRKGRKTLPYNGASEEIAISKVMFGDPVNSISGWAYGVPDVLASIGWAESYRQMVVAGQTVTEAMAGIWAVAKSNSAAGMNNAALAMGGGKGAGGVAHMSNTNEFSVLPTAGQSYDFSKLLPILANFAAGIGVSVIELSANPGNAGGSYGAARSLNPVTIAMTLARRKYHIALDTEVLVWLGCKPEDIKVYFDPVADMAETYRLIQAVLLMWGSGLFKPEEIKLMLNQAFNVEGLGEGIPDGVLLPNNEESLARKDIDADASTGSGMTPTQGSGAQFGKGGSGDQTAQDIRSREDLMAFFQNEDMMKIMSELAMELRASREGA